MMIMRNTIQLKKITNGNHTKIINTIRFQLKRQEKKQKQYECNNNTKKLCQ